MNKNITSIYQRNNSLDNLKALYSEEKCQKLL